MDRLQGPLQGGVIGTTMTPESVVVIGGGLAGIAASLRLAEAGVKAVVVETRPRLGGRATSFVDPRSGRTLDNCQHVVMGCCTNLLDLYDRLGVLDRIEWHRSTWWADPPRPPRELRPGRLAPPLHFTGSFLRFGVLTLAERRAVGRAMWRLIRMGFAGREAWRGKVFHAFLEAVRQPAGAIERFWEPVVVSACNLPCAKVDAASAMQVFQEGFLGSDFASAIGLSRVPLVDLYDPAEALLARSGGEVRLGLSAKAIAFERDRVTGVVTDEGFIPAGAVISTVPWDRLSKLCSETLRAADRRLQRLDALRPSPILGVHLFFAEPIMQTPHLVLPGRATQWLFNKGVDESGRAHLHAVISAADAWMELDEREIARRVLDDIRWAYPGSGSLEPLEVRSVKEKRATFACEAGVDAFRPGCTPDFVGIGAGCRNLFIAGDWCRTGWPATMEGAVRSGYHTAQAITGSGGVIADLPIGRLVRWLGLR
ncbi:MAG: hydroxysqualene dehydroxylase HpnE [Phycisphaeraceae bacterium]|nr:hydroxysqualene dehydroxylase HpnE [Phycisphaeraceae bacterium]